MTLGFVGKLDWGECDECKHFSEDEEGTHCTEGVWDSPSSVVRALEHDLDFLTCKHFEVRADGKSFFKSKDWKGGR